MSKEKSKLIYFQTPKIMTDHPKITGDHIYIFMPLYDQLRQAPCNKTGYNKTNEYLSEFSKASLSTVKRKLNDLESWGFLERIGIGHNRKFFLGTKFKQQGQIDLVSNSSTGSQRPSTGSQRPSTGSKTHYIAKNVIKNKTKNGFAHAKTSTPNPKTPSTEDFQDYHWHKKNNPDGVPLML